MKEEINGAFLQKCRIRSDPIRTNIARPAGKRNSDERIISGITLAGFRRMLTSFTASASYGKALAFFSRMRPGTSTWHTCFSFRMCRTASEFSVVNAILFFLPTRIHPEYLVSLRPPYVERNIQVVRSRVPQNRHLPVEIDACSTATELICSNGTRFDVPGK